MVRCLAIFLSCACLSWAAPAFADGRIVLLMVEPERRAELAEALAVEVAGRRVELVAVDPPQGETGLARAAAAQTGTRLLGALAAVWVDRAAETGASLVRVVGPDGEHVRHAPLPEPIEQVPPRIFAVVANSLLEELTAPPEGPITVRVQVHVEAPGREVSVSGDVDTGAAGALAEAPAPEAATHEPTPPPPPIVVVTPAQPMPEVTASAVAQPGRDVGDDDEGPLLPREGFFLEGSALFAGISAGGTVGLGYHLSESLRLGASMTAALVFTEGDMAYLPALFLTRIGGDRSWRFDWGVQLGMLFVEHAHTETIGRICIPDDPWCTATTTVDTSNTYVGWVGGVHAGWAFELEDLGLGFRLALNVASVEGGSPIIAPFATGFVELPL